MSTTPELIMDEFKPNPEAEFFIAAWRTLAQEAWDNAGDKGFWDGVLNIPAQLAGVHGEVSEILSALEHGDPESKKIPGFKSSEEEAADVVLRIMSMATGAGWRVAEAIIAKMRYNETRERLHGKEF